MRIRKRRTAVWSRRSRGQSLVEFALVIPIFITLVVAIAEFAFLFGTFLSASFTSRDGVQVAAEMGNSTCADEVVLQRIEQDITAPADATKILSVDIFWSDNAGNPIGSAINTWTRTGSSQCTLPSNTIITIPYQRTANGYPLANRCNVLSAVGCASGHTSIDTIGVKITYQYSWITPLPQFVGGSGTGMQIVQSNMMRMEPVK
jgi:hypothetical protein